MVLESISNCSSDDYLQILNDIEDFWGSSRTLSYHHPMFVHEFGNSSFVIKDGSSVVAYLFGFISQTDSTGYVHLVAVRQSYQRKGFANQLYQHFISFLKDRGVEYLKAITSPTNHSSIGFHLNLGMSMIGDDVGDGTKLVRNYSGIGQDRVVFKMKF